MDLGLKGKGVIITGASKGIGRSIALGFAEEGANVAICARGEEALAETTGELVALGVKVHSEVCDVADEDALVRTRRSARRQRAARPRERARRSRRIRGRRGPRR